MSLRHALIVFLLLATNGASQGAADPYESLKPEQKAILQPSVERFIADQLHQKWADLWEIQDQTSDLKNELLLGNRNAPDMTREQFVEAMKETIGSGYPQLRSFALEEVKPDNEDFIVWGCGKATRESWHQTSEVSVVVKIINGKAKFGLFEVHSDPCSKK